MGASVMAAVQSAHCHDPTQKGVSESRLEVWLEKGPQSK